MCPSDDELTSDPNVPEEMPELDESYGDGIKENFYGGVPLSANFDPDPDGVRALSKAFIRGTQHKEVSLQIVDLNGIPHIATQTTNGWNVAPREDVLERPARQKGCIGNFTDHASFALHFNQQKNPFSRIYLDDRANPVKARAIFDENEDSVVPFWREQYSTLTLSLDEQWKEWIALISKTGGVSQRDFAEFLEDNQRTISTEYQGHLIESTKIFTATKQVEYIGATDLENGDVQFKYNEVTTAASAGKAGTVEVPRKFTIEIPVFKGGVPYLLECRLRYRVASDGLKFFVKIPSIQKAFDDAVKDVRTAIETTTGITVFIGTP